MNDVRPLFFGKGNSFLFVIDISGPPGICLILPDLASRSPLLRYSGCIGSGNCRDGGGIGTPDVPSEGEEMVPYRVVDGASCP